jgi:hypothetical protein
MTPMDSTTSGAAAPSFLGKNGAAGPGIAPPPDTLEVSFD